MSSSIPIAHAQTPTELRRGLIEQVNRLSKQTKKDIERLNTKLDDLDAKVSEEAIETAQQFRILHEISQMQHTGATRKIRHGKKRRHSKKKKRSHSKRKRHSKKKKRSRRRRR
jgi:hypothetical protein